MLAMHDGRRGYTSNSGTVWVLDLVGRKTLAVIPVSGQVQRIAISADDNSSSPRIRRSPQLAVIDTATNKVKQWVPLPGLGYGTAATPDGHWLLVAVPSTNQVAVVDLAKMQVTRRIDVATSPQEILIRPTAK